jgi:putative ABC transport system permease protein
VLTGADRTVISAILKATPDANLELLAKQIRFELGKQETVRDFSVLTPAKTSELIGNVLSLVELFLIIIALISLVVGAVGIMNTMYTSVLERTKQIGIMKAIGATSENVLSLFLLESGIIGLTGGLMGITGGIFISFLIGLFAGKLGTQGLFSFASLDFYGFGVILFVTFITGIFAGLLPARQASKMEPAEALRYE